MGTIVPPLVKRLGAGLEVAGVEFEVREFFFDSLMKAHTNIMSQPVKGAGAPPPPPIADVELDFCRQGSGWACNEAGIMHLSLAASGEDLRRLDPTGATEPFRSGCALGVAAACRNLEVMAGAPGMFERPEPTLEDYPIVLRGSKGPVREEGRSALYAMACRQGWYGACEMV